MMNAQQMTPEDEQTMREALDFNYREPALQRAVEYFTTNHATVSKIPDADDGWRIQLDVSDDSMTVQDARELAAAVLRAADSIEGTDSALVSLRR